MDGWREAKTGTFCTSPLHLPSLSVDKRAGTSTHTTTTANDTHLARFAPRVESRKRYRGKGEGNMVYCTKRMGWKRRSQWTDGDVCVSLHLSLSLSLCASSAFADPDPDPPLRLLVLRGLPIWASPGISARGGTCSDTVQPAVVRELVTFHCSSWRAGS